MAGKRRRLAARRRALGFTQESLAERLGVHPTTVRRWESGGIGSGPQPWVRRKLAEHLQVSAEELEELLSDRHEVLPWHSADEEDDVNRRALLNVLGAASTGEPLKERGPEAPLKAPGKRWPPRYAARRIAWHALDHAWEIEDRST